MLDKSSNLRPGRPKDAVKRLEIVLAATELFMENGYELTSMEAVARRAGVSKLTIYSHFADKNELFRAIMQQRCDKMGMPKSFMTEAQLPVETALMQIGLFAASLIFREDTIRLMRVIQAEAARHPEIVETYYDYGPRRVKTAFADLLAEFDRQGQIAVPDAARATEQFFSLLKGEKIMRALMLLTPQPDAADLQAHVRATVSFFLSAYRPLKKPATEKSNAEKSNAETETP